MFFPYSSDISPRYRPWLADILFPVFVVIIFVLFNARFIPNSMLFFASQDNGVEINRWFFGIGLLLLLHIIWSCFVMWTLGRTLCIRIGNLFYGVFFITIAAVGFIIAFLFRVEDSPLIWLPCWIMGGVAGMCLMFLPNNIIECFFIIPPWRSFSVDACWIYLSLLIVDVVVSVFFGWTAALIMHPLAFVIGFLSGWLLSKKDFVIEESDSYTFWQWVKGEAVSDSAWEDSWSVRKKQKTASDSDNDGDSPLPRPKKIGNPDSKPAETIGVLCNCGEVLHVPIAVQGKRVRCPACSNVLRIPETPR